MSQSETEVGERPLVSLLQAHPPGRCHGWFYTNDPPNGIATTRVIS
jgi:hypothetical protein